jgi:hypothetical protein
MSVNCVLQGCMPMRVIPCIPYLRRHYVHINYWPVRRVRHEMVNETDVYYGTHTRQHWSINVLRGPPLVTA